jgi:hypothetical protein
MIMGNIKKREQGLRGLKTDRKNLLDNSNEGKTVL